MGADSSKCTRHDLSDRRKESTGVRPKRKARSSSHSPPSTTLTTTSERYSDPISPDENGKDDEDDEERGEEIINPRNEGSFPSKSSDFDNRSHFMERRDRMLIVKSWRKTQKTGAEHVGSKIFLRVLTAQPDIKAIFGLEKIPQGRLKYDPRFRQHAIVYTKTFDYVVKNLEFADKLEHHFDALGRRHVQYQGRGFDPSFWETFAECMTQAAAEWDQHRHRPTTSAWRNLVSTIIKFMRRGYDDEMGRKKSLVFNARGYVPPSRKTSGYLQTACPIAHPTYTAAQAQELYATYAHAHGDRRHSISSDRRNPY